MTDWLAGWLAGYKFSPLITILQSFFETLHKKLWRALYITQVTQFFSDVTSLTCLGLHAGKGHLSSNQAIRSDSVIKAKPGLKKTNKIWNSTNLPTLANDLNQVHGIDTERKKLRKWSKIGIYVPQQNETLKESQESVNMLLKRQEERKENLLFTYKPSN